MRYAPTHYLDRPGDKGQVMQIGAVLANLAYAVRLYLHRRKEEGGGGDLAPYSGTRGVNGHTVVPEKRVRKLKLKFRASLITKLKFKGRFEEISASPSCWCA